MCCANRLNSQKGKDRFTLLKEKTKENLLCVCRKGVSIALCWQGSVCISSSPGIWGAQQIFDEWVNDAYSALKRNFLFEVLNQVKSWEIRFLVTIVKYVQKGEWEGKFSLWPCTDSKEVIIERIINHFKVFHLNIGDWHRMDFTSPSHLPKILLERKKKQLEN